MHWWKLTIEPLSVLNRVLNRECFDLRSNNTKLYFSKPNTNAMKRNLRFEGAMIWNSFSQNNYTSYFNGQEF